MVAAKVANMNVGKPNTANLQNNNTRSEAAEMLNVSERLVNTAKKVQESATDDVIDQVNNIIPPKPRADKNRTSLWQSSH